MKVYKNKLISNAQNKISKNDTFYILESLATLLCAGIPIIETLEIVKFGLTQNKKQIILNLILQNLIRDLENGMKLSKTIKINLPKLNNIHIELIKISEHTGKLDETLNKIVITEKKWQELKQNIYKNLTYPIIIILATIGSCIFIFNYVIPEFTAIYKQLNLDLPITTKIIILISSKVKMLFIPTFIFCIITCFILKKIYKQKKFFFKFSQNVIYNFVFIGPIIQKLLIFRIFQNLGICLQAGLPLTESLKAIKRLPTNPKYQNAISKIQKFVINGESLNKSISVTKLFPIIIPQMINFGEKTGNLDEILLKIASIFEREAKNSITKCLTLLEPLLLSVLGIVIISLVLAIYLPVLNLGAII